MDIVESETFRMKAKKASRGNETENELLERRWSVVSFDKCEATNLTYELAAKKLSELAAAKVAGLCIVTDEAATRMCGPKS